MSKLVKIADLTPEQLRDLKAQGERGVQITIDYPFTTGALVRGMAQKIAFEIASRGFEIVQQTHDGGLISRRHVISFRGNVWEAVKFAGDLDAFLAQAQGEGS